MISALEAWSKTNEALKTKEIKWTDIAYRLINEAAEDGKFSVSIEYKFSERLINLFTNLGYEVTVIPAVTFSNAYTIIKWANPEHNNI